MKVHFKNIFLSFTNNIIVHKMKLKLLLVLLAILAQTLVRCKPETRLIRQFKVDFPGDTFLIPNLKFGDLMDIQVYYQNRDQTNVPQQLVINIYEKQNLVKVGRGNGIRQNLMTYTIKSSNNYNVKLVTASQKPIQYRIYIKVNNCLVVERFFDSDVYYNKQRSTYRLLLSPFTDICDKAYLETLQSRYFRSVKIFNPISQKNSVNLDLGETYNFSASRKSPFFKIQLGLSEHYAFSFEHNYVANAVRKTSNFDLICQYQSAPVCGDKYRQTSQVCDNGNQQGCVNCKIEPGYTCTGQVGEASSCFPVCGNGILTKREKCDNGNKTGCLNCVEDFGYYCTGNLGQISVCNSICGDNILIGYQICDNGNKTGCSKNCIQDYGYKCQSELLKSSNCSTICGDGIFMDGQKCDNKNQVGCLHNCEVDLGYSCINKIGESSNCFEVCGNNIVTVSQACDTGNGLGCSKNCVQDVGYTCSKIIGEPSSCKPICGNNIRSQNQYCDNGNNTGCINCLQNRGYKCSQELNKRSICQGICGDNIFVQGQGCDNGNSLGCQKGCSPDPGYVCNNTLNQKSYCFLSNCGDNILASAEICDNGNKTGCSKNCVEDKGYYCTGRIGSSSICNTRCGDSIRAGTQQCDNGNDQGCSQNCKVDSGHKCKGQIGEMSLCFCLNQSHKNIQKKSEKSRRWYDTRKRVEQESSDQSKRHSCETCKKRHTKSQPHKHRQYEESSQTSDTSDNSERHACNVCGFNHNHDKGKHIHIVVPKTCGNAKKQRGQECDNGNQTGCINCRIQPGYYCSEDQNSTSKCLTGCGDGIMTTDEQCDNGQLMGCHNCKIEQGYKCISEVGSKSICANCGNSIVQYRQTCDNGRKEGCLNCEVQPGYECTGISPSICRKKARRCGDKIRQFNEDCDDGNLVNGDGCTYFCKVEFGYKCEGPIGYLSFCHKSKGKGAQIQMMQQETSNCESSRESAK